MTQPTIDPTIEGWGSTYDVAEGPNHQIDTSVPGGAFASVRDKAWHNLGTVREGQVDALTLLQDAYGDYPVWKVEPSYISFPVLDSQGQPVKDAGGEPVYIDRKVDRQGNTVMTVRENPHSKEIEVLGNVAPSYPVWTGREVFVGFADALIEVAHPTVSTAGVLYGGRQQFMSFKLPEGIKIGDTDSAELWLIAKTSHDGSCKASFAASPIRTVCQNTWRVGLSKAVSRWDLKHTKNAKFNLQAAREALDLTYGFAKGWAAEACDLLDFAMSTAKFEKVLEDTFGPGEDASKRAQDAWDAKLGKLLGLWRGDTVQGAGIGGTAWGAVNVVSEYAQWVSGNMVSAERHDMDDTGYRMWRAIDGEKTFARPVEEFTAKVKELVKAG